jgi:hypothetical protein
MEQSARKTKDSLNRSLRFGALKAVSARFPQRVTDLLYAYAMAWRLTPELRRAAFQLKADIDYWGAGSGQQDMRAIYLALTKPPDDSWTCDNCDLIMVSRGRLCFLVGCDPAYKNCSYVCLERPTNHKLRR